MKYQIITNPNPETLTLEVNKALADGWKPQGSIALQAFPMTTQTRSGK